MHPSSMTDALHRSLYGLLCVVVPCVVGAVMYAGFEIWSRRRMRTSARDPLPPVDYTI